MYIELNSLTSPILSGHTAGTSLAVRPICVRRCSYTLHALHHNVSAQHGSQEVDHTVSLKHDGTNTGPAPAVTPLSTANLAQGTVNTSHMAQGAEFRKSTHLASMNQVELDRNAARSHAVYHSQRRQPTMFLQDAYQCSAAVAAHTQPSHVPTYGTYRPMEGPCKSVGQRQREQHTAASLDHCQAPRRAASAVPSSL
ncbi:hypothetical protein VTO73DRAFT_15093 [Trametes versicolor]